MAVIHTYLTCELQKLLKVQYLDGNLFSQDNQANEFHVIVLDNGEPAEISGTVTADVIRSDGGTVAVTGGTIEGNVASITFNAAVYAIPGVVSIVVKLTTSGVVTTIAAAVTNVYQSSTSVTVDPGTIIPSIQTLISSIETAVASIPADYSSLWTSLAPAFSSSASYMAGQYCTYNGAVYRFNTSHSGSWAAGDVTAVNIGGELTALKSAIAIIPDGIKAAAGFQMATFFSGYESTVAEGETSAHVENANYISAKIPATSTDYVEFCGEGGSGNQRLYAVLDAENKVLFRSTTNASGIKTPTMSNYPTAAYVIVNVKKSYTGATYLFVGQTIDKKIEQEIAPVLVDVEKEIDEVEKSVSVGGTWDVDLSDFGIVYATISSTKKWNVGVGYQSYAVNVQPYSFATVTIKAKADATCLLGFMTSKEIGADQSTVTTFADGESGRRTIDADGTGTFTLPSNCTYILIGKKSSGNDITPVSVSISGSRNTIVEVEKKLQEIDFSSVEQNPLRAINSTSSGRDIPQSIAIRNAYKKAHQLLDLPWVALLPYPKTETPNTYAQPGDKIAVPYSSVKEYNKFVGFNVSIRTFMTAVHNPYSLMYTEDTLETHQQSAYGIEYHGSNCGPYFGDVCSSFDLLALGLTIPWTTDQFDYLEKIGRLHRLTDQSANGVRLMDIIWEPGHTTLVTDILRDERGTPTQITVSEYGPKTTNYTPEQFNERLRTKHGIIYMYMDLYKNLEYSPSEFVAVDGEPTPPEYTYNDDICTFAGDYACFNSGEDIYINYAAGNYTQMQVYKGETLIETISLVAADHAVKITPDGYGKYKARLTNGNDNSDYTYFEIVDTNLSASYSNGQLTINFSSANGEPSYAEIVNRAGFTRGFIELDEKAISEGTITVNPQMILAEQLPGTSLPSTFYPRVLFKGEYGMVANPFYAVQT